MKKIKYTADPKIFWVVENNGIYILNQTTGANVYLDYPQAAVWDLVSQNYDHDYINRLIALIGKISKKAATELVAESLEIWVKNGFLVKNG